MFKHRKLFIVFDYGRFFFYLLGRDMREKLSNTFLRLFFLELAKLFYLHFTIRLRNINVFKHIFIAQK